MCESGRGSKTGNSRRVPRVSLARSVHTHTHTHTHTFSNSKHLYNFVFYPRPRYRAATANDIKGVCACCHSPLFEIINRPAGLIYTASEFVCVCMCVFTTTTTMTTMTTTATYHTYRTPLSSSMWVTNQYTHAHSVHLLVVFVSRRSCA